MFSVWGVNGAKNAYRPVPIGAPARVEAVGEEDDPDKRSSGLWKRVQRDQEKKEASQKYRKQFSHQRRLFEVHEVMTFPVHTVNKEDPIEFVQDQLRKFGMTHLVVVDQGKHIVGIVSEKDVLRALAGLGRPLSKQDKNLLAEDIMSSDVISVHPNTSIRRVAEVMFNERIGAMPVTDQEKGLVGIVTRNDILKALVRFAPLKLWS